MRIIDRYISQQVLTTGLFAVGVLSLVLVLGNVFKQLLDLLVNHDVPIQFIITFIAYIIPFSLTFTIPVGISDSGAADLRAAFGGERVDRAPVQRGERAADLRAGLRAGDVVRGDLFLDQCRCGAQSPGADEGRPLQYGDQQPDCALRERQTIDQFPGKLIYVEKKTGTELDNILMYQLNQRGQPTMVVHAKSGELKTELTGQQPEIILRLKEAQYEQRDSVKPDNLSLIHSGITIQENDLAISLDDLYEKNKKKRGPSQMTLTELLKQQVERNMDKQQLSAIKTETNKRFSFSLASFAFCLIAVPLAITAHRKETSIGFLFSLVVAFIYFFFIVMVDTVRSNPKFHPELLIWLPNVVFISLGACLFYRMSRR